MRESFLAKRISVFPIYRETGGRGAAQGKQSNRIIKHKSTIHRRNIRDLLTSLIRYASKDFRVRKYACNALNSRTCSWKLCVILSALSRRSVISSRLRVPFNRPEYIIESEYRYPDVEMKNRAIKQRSLSLVTASLRFVHEENVVVYKQTVKYEERAMLFDTHGYFYRN